jgi:hypothetical protein
MCNFWLNPFIWMIRIYYTHFVYKTTYETSIAVAISIILIDWFDICYNYDLSIHYRLIDLIVSVIKIIIICKYYFLKMLPHLVKELHLLIFNLKLLLQIIDEIIDETV